MSAEKAGQVLGAMSSFAGMLSPMVGGAAGAGLAGAAAITKLLSEGLLLRGQTVQAIMAHLAAMPEVKLKWTPDLLDETSPQTPSAKDLAAAAAKKDGV